MATCRFHLFYTCTRAEVHPVSQCLFVLIWKVPVAWTHWLEPLKTAGITCILQITQIVVIQRSSRCSSCFLGWRRAKQSGQPYAQKEESDTFRRKAEKMVQNLSTGQTTPFLEEPETWRDLLAILISDKKVRTQTVEVTGLTEVTLRRWTRGTTTPRSHMLRPLLIAFPQYAELFIRLIVKEFTESATSERPEFVAQGYDPDHVAVDTYERVLAVRATTPLAHRFW